jgi:hypothetical protein
MTGYIGFPRGSMSICMGELFARVQRRRGSELMVTGCSRQFIVVPSLVRFSEIVYSV